MRSLEELRPGEGRQALARVGGVVFAVALAAACAGENLFTGPASAGGLLGPEVEITAPESDVTIAPGDSVNVTAEISGRDVVEVAWTGFLEAGGEVPFVSFTAHISPVNDTTMSSYVKRQGTTPGPAKIVVTATDISGDTGADTISVTLGS